MLCGLPYRLGLPIELTRRILMKLISKSLAVLSAVAIAGSTMALTTLPAEAAQTSGVGSGKAIIRIDATKATVKKTGDGKYTLTVPKNSAGQWMGERTDAAGKTKVRVGNVSASALGANWGNFRYGKAGTRATLAWNIDKGALFDGAVVIVKQPKTTGNGVSFPIETKNPVPATLKNLTLNIERAPGKSTRANYITQWDVTITNDLHSFAGFTDSDSVNARLYNDTNDNTCWSYAYPSSAATKVVDLPDGRCDDIAYTATTSSWKTTSTLNEQVVNMSGTFTPDGEAAFNWQTTVLTIEPEDWFM